jgi:hypothetical protein
MRCTVLISLVVFCIALADGAQAQVVQLPTFRFFGISTTVSVPDSGGAYLGGNSRSSRGSIHRGLPGLSKAPVVGRPFGNRGIAGSTETGGMSVHAQIHDFEAMEQALVGQATEVARHSPPAARFSNHAAAAKSDRASVAAIRQQQAARQSAITTEARQDYDRARELLAAGKTGVAKIYLQRAAKSADPQLRGEIQTAWQALLSAPTLAEAKSRAAR